MVSLGVKTGSVVIVGCQSRWPIIQRQDGQTLTNSLLLTKFATDQLHVPSHRVARLLANKFFFVFILSGTFTNNPHWNGKLCHINLYIQP